MKKLAKILVLALVLTIAVACFVACGEKTTIDISSDGYWVIDGVKTEHKAIGENGINGIDGENGIDGVTPTIEISSDGYWIINGNKTEYKAIGVDGIDGKDGVDGAPGKDGKDGEDGQDGIDGVTPTIEISADGYWVINGIKTEYRATTVEEEEPIPTEPTEGVVYVLNDYDGRKSASVVGYVGVSKKVKIADTFEGKPVTRIAEGAFAYKNITYIDIPESITEIGDLAFGHCYILEEIRYNAIDPNIYYDVVLSACGIYTDGITVHIGASVKSIPTCLFSDRSIDGHPRPNIKSVIFEEGSVCERIENCAFYGLYRIKEIVIPNSVTSIDYDAFSNCPALTIYSEAESQPSGWNYSDRPVYWYSETEPTGEGNYWRYVDGVPTKW